MFIHLNDNENPMPDICDALGKDEVLEQLAGKSGRLEVVSQLSLLGLKGDAFVYLTEACADVLLRIEGLIELGLVDRNSLQFVGRYKRDQWHKQVCGENGQTIWSVKSILNTKSINDNERYSSNKVQKRLNS